MFCIAKKDRWDQEASPTLHQLIGVEVDNRGGMRIPIALAIALLFATGDPVGRICHSSSFALHDPILTLFRMNS